MASIKGCALVMTAEAMASNRAGWLMNRNMGIGGSDAGAIVGLNPYKGAYQVWLEKTNQAAPQDASEKEAVYWGNVLEPVVATEFTARTGKKVTRHGMLRSKEYPFLLANVDRLVMGEDAGLEIKTAGAFKAKDWEEDKVPDSYYVQCQHYMMVTGLARWYIAALIGGQHFVWKCIERNEDDITALFDAEKEFWAHVQDMTPPDIDGSEACASALAERFQGGEKESVRLPKELVIEVENIRRFEEFKKNAEQSIRESENRIKAFMGNHEEALFQDSGTEIGRITWKPQPGRTSIDAKRLKAEKPEIYEAYKKQGKPFRVFRFC